MNKGRPIANAFAVVPDPDHAGRYFALQLHDVYAESFTHLEPSGRSSDSLFQVNRIKLALDKMHQTKGWAK